MLHPSRSRAVYEPRRNTTRIVALTAHGYSNTSARRIRSASQLSASRSGRVPSALEQEFDRLAQEVAHLVTQLRVRVEIRVAIEQLLRDGARFEHDGLVLR